MVWRTFYQTRSTTFARNYCILCCNIVKWWIIQQSFPINQHFEYIIFLKNILYLMYEGQRSFKQNERINHVEMKVMIRCIFTCYLQQNIDLPRCKSIGICSYYTFVNYVIFVRHWDIRTLGKIADLSLIHIWRWRR